MQAEQERQRVSQKKVHKMMTQKNHKMTKMNKLLKGTFDFDLK